MKLTGHARVEATPFAEVPLQRATLTCFGDAVEGA